MARVSHTVIDPKGPYEASISANAADLAFVAADTGNKEAASLEYPIIVLVWNTSADTDYTVTFESSVDQYNREQDITAYEVEAGEMAAFEFKGHGWKQSDGNLYFEASNAAVKFAVLKA